MVTKEQLKDIRHTFGDLYNVKRYSQMKAIKVVGALYGVPRGEVEAAVIDMIKEIDGSEKKRNYVKDVYIPDIVLNICKDEALSYVKLSNQMEKHEWVKESEEYREKYQELRKFLFDMGVVV